MTDEKEPSKEALAYNDALFNGWPISEDARRRTALALDAWGEALLRRQAEPDTGYKATTRKAEKAAHEATKAKLAGSVSLELYERICDMHIAKHDELAAEKAAHAATKAELEATRKELAGWEQSARGARDEVLALREKLTSAEAELESLRKPLEAVWEDGYSCGHADARFAKWGTHPNPHSTTEAVLAKQAKAKAEPSKPLEGELAEALKRLRWGGCRKDSPFYETAVEAAYALVEAALRAKGEPQAAEPSHEQMGCIDCAVGHPCDSQAAEPPEPRPIVVGSKWRLDGDELQVVGHDVRGWIAVRGNGERPTLWNPVHWAEEAEWLSDPQPAAPAPELPRKVEPGTTLTVGARYRITEISEWDLGPANGLGDEATCSLPGQLGTLKPEWREGAGAWYCRALEEGGGGAYVTGLELVAEAPKAGGK